MVQRSVTVSNQAELDALDGCERIGGTFTLHLFPGIDQAPLLSLQTVEGGLTVHGTTERVQSLDGFGSLQYVGRLFLDGVNLPDLGALGQLRSIGDPSRAGDRAERGLEITSCSGLTSLNGLGTLEYVARIHLNGNPDLVSIAGLGDVRPVAELLAIDCPLLDLQGLEQLSVETLSLSGTALASLEGLGNAAWLLQLGLSNNPALTSLQGGTFPPRMTQLMIEDADALANLRGLEGLQEVDLLGISTSHPELSSLASLAGLEGLEHVGFFSLSGMTSLAHLSGLDGLQRVGQLQIMTSGLRDLTGMPSLRQIDDFSVLTAPELTGLDGLGSASITSFWLNDIPLTTLAGLEQLHLVAEGQLNIGAAPQLVSLQGLPPLTTLLSLSLSETPALADLQALAGLTAVQYLSLSSTGLIQLDGLSNLRVLLSLYLDSNPALVQIDALSGAAGLSELFIANNAVLQTWPSTLFSGAAAYVTVYNNQALTALPAFSGLRSAVLLSIEDNPNLAALDLSSLESAEVLYIRGNSSLDDGPLEPLRRLLPRTAQVKIVSNLSGPERLSPCPWTNDGVCDELRGDCAERSDTSDCR